MKYVLLLSDNKIFASIKNRCPAEITFDQIKVVMGYLEIRDHIKKFYSDYEEFDNDDIDQNEDDNKEQQICEKPVKSAFNGDATDNDSNGIINELDNTEEDIDDAALNALVNEIETGGYFNNVEGSHIKNTEQPPLKKQKLSMALLDSPPRRTTKTS